MKALWFKGANGDLQQISGPREPWPKRIGSWVILIVGAITVITALYRFGVLAVPFITEAQAKTIVRDELASVKEQLVEQKALLNRLLDCQLHKESCK